MLQIKNIAASYGTSQVLWDISLGIAAGEVVTLIGRNGMGKSTTIKTLMGQLPIKGGSILFDGREISGMADYRIAQAGIGLVPEGRGIFPNLTVKENLICAATNRRQVNNPWVLHRVYERFPRLKERETNLGSNLSGGEQQMLAIGRALMTNPRLLILDEATEGLAPLIRREIWQCLGMLKDEGQAMLVVDKNLAPLSKLADRHYVIEKGRVVWTGDSAALEADGDCVRQYVGL
ncbi:ABC transporter ATP-binding protein [Paraburkholderia tuberum]|uniref:Amino acid/amide ABC transporter ATP-binding protein 2, HAAT family n=1 Tax=Paraburkholderia tuberum TaxID=157910 RepID=A0A1H1KHK6_9BURK|nr:ABC transporter ATP-binding protein [Paraburkholderia tuberum]SDR61562.1 amino acid/amide ABC transporter ATP-binding protein 2, HAAT family [Paraburkholderia tuberum]